MPTPTIKRRCSKCKTYARHNPSNATLVCPHCGHSWAQSNFKAPPPEVRYGSPSRTLEAAVFYESGKPIIAIMDGISIIGLAATTETAARSCVSQLRRLFKLYTIHPVADKKKKEQPAVSAT